MLRQSPGPIGPPSPLRRVLLMGLLALAALASLAGTALAADPVQVPPNVVEPLGAVDGAVVVPYAQLVGAADARNLNAAVVDTSSYWVAAIDGRGRVIASEIPRPQAGRDFAQADGAPKAAAPALPGAFELATHLRADGVAVLGPAAVEEDSGSSGGIMRYLAIPLGVGILAAVLIGGMMLIRGRNPNGRGANGRGGAAGHGKIRKNAQVEPPKVRFTDVAGCDEVVEELTEVVTFLREPERFSAVGARMPRGVILHGPPGTGKTLIAKAVAGEAGVPFFALSGSDFVDTFVGVGASRVRDLFAEARKDEKGTPNRGAIIFFDEIDAIGRARGQGNSGADSEREGTLNQLLVELDGFGDPAWTCSTRRSCGPAASTGGCRWASRRRRGASRSCASTRGRCRSRSRTPWRRSPASPRASRARTCRTW